MESGRIEIATGSGQPLGMPLDLGEFELYVNIGSPLPPIEELRRQFPGTNNVSGILDGRPFQEHELRIGANKKPGNRIVIAKCFNREIESEAAINEMFPQGWIPLGVRGAYDFACKHYELMRLYWFIASGEYTRGACYERLVLALSGGLHWLTLGSRDFYNKWPAHFLHLFEHR